MIRILFRSSGILDDLGEEFVFLLMLAEQKAGAH